MSDQPKTPPASAFGLESASYDDQPTTDNNPVADVEAQMRRALGLYGGGMRIRNQDQSPAEQAPSRAPMDRFGQQAGAQNFHRRRFVQDGEVQVQVVRRDTAAADPSAPQSSRLQRTEAQLHAEVAAREKAERALAEVQQQVSILKTQIGHADLSRNEASDALRRERENVANLRQKIEELQEELHSLRADVEAAHRARDILQDTLSDERNMRKRAERVQKEETERADRAEALTQRMEWAKDAQVAETVSIEPRNRRAAAAHPPAQMPVTEGEPVKWWLAPDPKAKARAR